MIREFLRDNYPQYELHERWLKPNDLLVEEIQLNGEVYLVKEITRDVLHYCKKEN